MQYCRDRPPLRLANSAGGCIKTALFAISFPRSGHFFGFAPVPDFGQGNMLTAYGPVLLVPAHDP